MLCPSSGMCVGPSVRTSARPQPFWPQTMDHMALLAATSYVSLVVQGYNGSFFLLKCMCVNITFFPRILRGFPSCIIDCLGSKVVCMSIAQNSCLKSFYVLFWGLLVGWIQPCIYMCSDPECRLLASASKDSTVRVWDTILSKAVLVLSGHTHGVTCVQWGGEGLLYTASQDRTIKVWRAQDVSSLQYSGHLEIQQLAASLQACSLHFEQDNLPTKDTLLDTFLVPLRRGPLINRFGWSQSVLSKEVLLGLACG